MRAYQDMMYGLTKEDPVQRENWKRLLLQDCQLDPAAIAMIWLHWAELQRAVPPRHPVCTSFK